MSKTCKLIPPKGWLLDGLDWYFVVQESESCMTFLLFSTQLPMSASSLLEPSLRGNSSLAPTGCFAGKPGLRRQRRCKAAGCPCTSHLETDLPRRGAGSKEKQVNRRGSLFVVRHEERTDPRFLGPLVDFEAFEENSGFDGSWVRRGFSKP